MSDHDDAESAGVAESGEGAHELGAMFGSSAADGLVEEEEARLLGEGAGEDHHLLFASGEGGDCAFGEMGGAGGFQGLTCDGEVAIALEADEARVGCGRSTHSMARKGKAVAVDCGM